MAVASTGYVVLAKQTTEDIFEPRSKNTYCLFPAEETEIVAGKEFIDYREIRGSRQAMVTLDGPFRPTATMKGPVYPVGAVGLFLYGMFGGADAPASSGSGTATVYTHTFSDASTLPIFTIERADKVTGTAKIVEYLTDCKMESLQFACAFGEKVDITANFQAAARPNKHTDTFFTAASAAATAAAGSEVTVTLNDVAPSEIDPLIFSGATVYMADYGTVPGSSGSHAVSTIKSLNMEFTNTLTRQETLNGADYAYKIFEGGVEATLTGALVFETLDMYNKMLSGASVAIKVVFKSKTNIGTSTTPYELEFFWPKVKVSRASIPFTAGEVIESDVEFKVIFDQTSAKMVEVKLKNNEPDAYSSFNRGS